MRWALLPHEQPKKDGQYFVWSRRYGKCVMGFVDGSWGAQPPICWLSDDQCAHQAPDGSFNNGGVEVLT